MEQDIKTVLERRVRAVQGHIGPADAIELAAAVTIAEEARILSQGMSLKDDFWAWLGAITYVVTSQLTDATYRVAFGAASDLSLQMGAAYHIIEDLKGQLATRDFAIAQLEDELSGLEDA